MSTLWMEPGSDATQDFSLWTFVSGAVSSESTYPDTGSHSIQLTNGNPSVAAFITRQDIMDDAGRRFSFRIRFAQYGGTVSGGSATFMNIANSAGSTVFQFRLGSTNGTGAQCIRVVTQGTPANISTITTYKLPLNEFVHIALAYKIVSATDYTIRMWINGTLVVEQGYDGVNALLRTTTNRLAVNMESANWPVDSLMWIDNLYIDDQSTLEYPGNIRIVAKRPLTNGTTNGFTTQIGAGGSGYGTGHAPQVNEQPLSATNGWSMIGAGAAVTEQYNIEDQDTGDVNIREMRIVGVMGWLRAKTSTGTQTASRTIDGTTTADVALTTTTTTYWFMSATPNKYPARTGTDIGIVTTTALQTVSLYECGIIIAVDASRLTYRKTQRTQPAPFKPGRAR
jgi:hypothetical protein